MLVYWLFALAFGIGALQYRGAREVPYRNMALLVLAGIAITLLVGLRYEIGGDWSTYLELFQNIALLPLGDALGLSDPGYVFINWLASVLGVDIWLVNLVCALLFVWGLMRFVSRQPNPWLALAIAFPYLVIVVAMGYTRQAVAIGFIMASLVSLEDGRTGRFLLLISLAGLFHKTSVIILPVAGLSVSKSRWMSAALVSLFLLLLYYVLLASAADNLILNYAQTAYDSQGAAIRIAMNVPAALLFLSFRRRFGLNRQQSAVWTNLSLLALFAPLMLFVSAGSAAVDRMALYLIPLQIFVFSRAPLILSNDQDGISKENGYIKLSIICYCLIVQFTFLNFGQFARLWVPYHFWPIFDSSAFSA